MREGKRGNSDNNHKVEQRERGKRGNHDNNHKVEQRERGKRKP